MNLEPFGSSFESVDVPTKIVRRAFPEGMEDRTTEEQQSAEKVLDTIFTAFVADGTISMDDRVFVQKRAYVDFVKKAVELGIPTRFANSFLETRGIRLSKPEPTVMRPRLNLSAKPTMPRAKKRRSAKNVEIDEQTSKTSVEPSQKEMFGFE